MFPLSKFLFCCASLIGVTAAAKIPCEKNGGSAMSWEGLCTDKNYTFTDQCTVSQDGPDQCMVTANACGCQVGMGDELSGIGSEAKGCGNACVDFSTEIPAGKDDTCEASGSKIQFEGACDAGTFATHFTPQCQFDEALGSDNGPYPGILACTVTESACGCLWWTEDDSDDGHTILGLTSLCEAAGLDPCDYEATIDKASSSSSSNSSDVRMFVIATLLSSLVAMSL